MGDQIHTKKLFQGLGTERFAFAIMFKGKRCTSCKSPKPIMRIQTFVAVSDIPNPTVREATRLMVQAGEIPTVPLVTGKGIRTGEVYACADCAASAERAAARGPSFAIVVFDRLPRSEQPLVQVVR